METVSWAGFTAGLLLSLFILPAITGQAHWIDYSVWVLLAGYARSVHVFSVRRAGPGPPGSGDPRRPYAPSGGP